MPESEPTYLRVDFPDRFELQVFEKGRWWGQAQSSPEYFRRNPDGSYICSGWGSPIHIRCVERHDDYFVHVDGGGRRFRYRLVPLDSQ